MQMTGEPKRPDESNKEQVRANKRPKESPESHLLMETRETRAKR